MDRWEAAWSGRDPSAFGALCDPRVHYEDPVVDRPLEGAAALGEHARRLWGAFPDARAESTGPRLTGGGFVAAPMRLTGTHRGSVEEIPATNKPVVVHVVSFCELREGRLLRVREFFDLYDVARQLGVLPPRGGVGERAMLMLRGFGLRLGR